VSQPKLPYRPPNASYLDGFDISAVPMTRNEYGRSRQSVQDWLSALEGAAATFAGKVPWTPEGRYVAVIEVRIPWRADIDNYIKDMLDRSARQGVFGGQDERVDLVHAIKRWRVPAGEAGARMEIWRLDA
jgi:hypothetical protein